jgi:ubiquitin C-terminal hydrolase
MSNFKLNDLGEEYLSQAAVGKKIQKMISFPIEDLNLSDYVIGYKKDSYHYELYGVINHSGGVLGGHYTCYIKNINNQWYEFNDSKVSLINTNQLISPKAYCLFYRKKLTN